ncbi:25100_t:CDS:2, partial [Gigaspora margarita]
GNYWKALGYDKAKCIDLLIEFHKFIHHEDSYKVEFNSQNLSEEELWVNANMTTIPINLSPEANPYCENFKSQSKWTSSKGHGNMNYEVSNIVDMVLKIESNNN